MKRTILLLALAVGTMFAVGCGGDDAVSLPVRPNPPVQRKLDLSHRTDVLNNIEYAYNKKDASTYQELLDPNFTFFYSEGGQTPVQWGFQDEIKTTQGIFGAAISISMDLAWEDGVTWGEQVAGSETWYTTTVYYRFTIKIGDTTYIPDQGSRAQFTVRNAGTDEKPTWHLVEFRDLGAPSLAASRASSTEPSSWGKVKALYR